MKLTPEERARLEQELAALEGHPRDWSGTDAEQGVAAAYYLDRRGWLPQTDVRGSQYIDPALLGRPRSWRTAVRTQFARDDARAAALRALPDDWQIALDALEQSGAPWCFVPPHGAHGPLLLGFDNEVWLLGKTAATSAGWANWQRLERDVPPDACMALAAVVARGGFCARDVDTLEAHVPRALLGYEAADVGLLDALVRAGFRWKGAPGVLFRRLAKRTLSAPEVERLVAKLREAFACGRSQ